MNLNMIQPKNETQDLLLSITKNCETLIKQTLTKPEETLEFKLTKSRETFHFDPPISIEGSWMYRRKQIRKRYISYFKNRRNNI